MTAEKNPNTPNTGNKIIRHRTISRDLIISLVLAVTVVSILTIFINFLVLSRKAEQENKRKALEYLDFLKDSLELPLWNVDEEGVNKIGHSFIKNELVAKLIIKDSEGKVWFERLSNEPELLENSGKVIHQGQVIGVVELGLTPKFYKINNRRLLISSLITLLFVIAVLIGVAGFLLKVFLKNPFNYLIDRMDRIAEGDYEYKTRRYDQKEIETIISKFNDMAQKVENREKSLADVNARLNEEIGERKQTEKALAASEKRFRELANSLPQVVYEMDANGMVTFVNQNAFEFFGYTQDDLDKGIPGLQFLIPEDRDRGMNNIRRRLTGEDLGSQEYTALRKDGGTFPISVHVTPVIQDNVPVGLRGIMIDTTYLKKAEAEKKKLEAQLLQTQKMESIGTLAGGIAHDFNNILSPIIGYSELAVDYIEKDSLLHEYVQEILTAAQRAKDLVKQILTFSRQTEYEQKPVQVKSITKEVLSLLRSSLPATIEIRQNLQSDATILADPTQIHQILMNLCTNAGHAMAEKGGILTVELTKTALDSDFTDRHPGTAPGPFLKLTVSDTGEGMSPHVLDRIFEPFFTTKDQGKGTGMGLSVVLGIVQSLGGTITAYSDPGKGSVFNVFFPSLEKRAGNEKQVESPMPTGTECILFIDDEEPLTRIGQKLLESLGYDVVTRTSGIEALELFRSVPERFDVVITDMTMPNLTGDRLAEQLLKIKPDIPIILCTGFSTMIDEEKARAKGVRALINKPILKREIAEVIRRVLDGNQ
jgi:PAS domain S-box-containing protein